MAWVSCYCSERDRSSEEGRRRWFGWLATAENLFSSRADWLYTFVCFEGLPVQIELFPPIVILYVLGVVLLLTGYICICFVNRYDNKN